MKDYTISETVSLPSEGKIYVKQINPQITLHSMQTKHEMMRLSYTDYPYKNLCDIIDDCMVDNCGMSSYDMCMGDYQYLLYKLRIITYGKIYKLNVTCPFCGETYREDADLDELEIKKFDDNIFKYSEFDLPSCNKHVKIRFQTPRSVDNVSEQVKLFKKKASVLSGDATIVFTICSLIESIDGKQYDPATLEDFVRNLPMSDTNTILAYAEKLNNYIGINSQLETKCQTCGIQSNIVIKADKEFFRPALDI